MTTMNLEAVRDEIKAAAATCEGTPTAKFVAVLIAAGITDTKEIAAIMGVGERAVQKARKANHSSPNSETPNQGSRTTVRNEPQFANHSSVPNHSSPKSEPQFGRARVEGNNLPTNLETTVGSLVSPPTPSDAKPVADWRSAFGADDNRGVEFSNGRLALVNGTRAFWLEQFGGDDTALNLALVEAAGTLQRNSPVGLKLQVERKLANIARDTRDRDRRYERAAGSKAAKGAPGKSTAGISAARAVLEARKAREVHA